MNRCFAFVCFAALVVLAGCERSESTADGPTRGEGFIPVNISFSVNPVTRGQTTMGTVKMNDAAPKPLRTLNLTYSPAASVDMSKTETTTTVPAGADNSLPFRVTPKLTAPSVIVVTATEVTNNHTTDGNLDTK